MTRELLRYPLKIVMHGKQRVKSERFSKSGDLAHRIDDSFNSRKAGSILLCKPEISRKAGEEARERKQTRY